MGRYTGKTCRLLCMIGLTASFFLVEIVVGYITNSLALVGDSYHMLSDVIALIIGFASVRISKWRSRKNTYGWARAEVLGALTNAVFLIALCFTIFIEALQRLSHDDHINNPDLMLIVGGIGLGINIIGLIIFGSHGHSHGGHGHSHGGHGHSHSAGISNNRSPGSDKKDGSTCDGGDDDVAAVAIPQNRTKVNDSDAEPNEDYDEIEEIKLKSSAQLNMRAVFLHVMGDALGSVIVIISALVIKYVEGDWKYKIDPAMSMVLVIIILSTTIPLLRESALILLQTVPTHIRIHDLKDKLMTKVDGVMGIHEFHVWQLAGNRIIASAHIRCQNLRDYMRIAEQVKLFFHNEGIHSTTIQPEFAEQDSSTSSSCVLNCPCTDNCRGMRCCPEDRHKLNKQPVWMRCCRTRKKKSVPLNEIIVSPCDEKKVLLPEDLVTCDKANGCDDNGEVVNRKTGDDFPDGSVVCDNKHDKGKCSQESKELLSPKDSGISEQGNVQNGKDGATPVKDMSDDAKILDFFKNSPCKFGDKTLSEQEKDNSRTAEHPRSKSDPASKAQEQAPLRRQNNSLPAVNSAKYYPRFNPPPRLSRPQSMYVVPSPKIPSSLNIPQRTQSTELLKETPEPEPQVADGNATLPRKQHLKPQTVDGATSTSSFNAYASEDDLDRNIRRLKQDWKEIRGDMASRESVLNS